MKECYEQTSAIEKYKLTQSQTLSVQFLRSKAAT